MTLPYVGIVDTILETIKREKLVEVKGADSFGEGDYQYAITGAGIIRAREALDRSQYAAAAPVSIKVYNEAIRKQGMARSTVTEAHMRRALSILVLTDETFNRIGPAVNYGTSMFMYGPPWNGKTTIATAIGKSILYDTMYIPYAVDIDGQVVKLYDSVNHELDDSMDDTSPSTGTLNPGPKLDPRWLHIKRPFIMVGGELTLEGLDLVYDDGNKYYEAPYQVKANGGIFMIYDFGRQQVRPREFLNRWIVPLESRIDYLTLHTGRKIDVPFDVLVIFSTNLDPKDLVDEAFLRHLRHKIPVLDPSFDDYREIFKRVAKAKGVKYSDKSLAYLLQEHYIKPNRKLRASQPCDLCDQIMDLARYRNVTPEMSVEFLKRAADASFVDL